MPAHQHAALPAFGTAMPGFVLPLTVAIPGVMMLCLAAPAGAHGS